MHQLARDNLAHVDACFCYKGHFWTLSLKLEEYELNVRIHLNFPQGRKSVVHELEKDGTEGKGLNGCISNNFIFDFYQTRGC